jgi:hypothetical protein
MVAPAVFAAGFPAWTVQSVPRTELMQQAASSKREEGLPLAVNRT